MGDEERKGTIMIDLLTALTAAASLILALNIGANNSAAEMGPACGAGIRSRRQALILIAVFCTAGAVFAGNRVMETVGHKLLGEGTLTGNKTGALIILISAFSLMGAANLFRLPLSSAHAVVGATVGLGLYYAKFNTPVMVNLLVWWVVTPLASLLFSYLLGRLLHQRARDLLNVRYGEQNIRRVLGWAITLSGCWMAFSAGSNSLAKALGPAVGAGVFTPTTAAVAGGLAMACGALLLGGRVIRTVGKEITPICPICAVLVELVAGSIVFSASRYGIPVSLAEIVTCSVIGFSCAANGVGKTSTNLHVRRILAFWPASPVIAGAFAVGLRLLLK